MSAALKPKVTEGEISQVVDLKKLTGRDLSEYPDFQLEIAQAALDYMLERVSKGKGIGGEVFERNVYSKAYRLTDAYKAAGKKPRPVNMSLSGDMLGTIDFETEGRNKVKFAVNPDETPKAHGHMVGANNLPKREFFGFTTEELEKNVLKQFKGELNRIDEREKRRSSAILEALRALPTARFFRGFR